MSADFRRMTKASIEMQDCGEQPMKRCVSRDDNSSCPPSVNTKHPLDKHDGDVPRTTKRRRFKDLCVVEDDILVRTHPQTFINAKLYACGYRVSIRHFSPEVAHYFLPYEEGKIRTEVYEAIQEADIKQLRRFATPWKKDECLLHQRNSQGESLLHMACRWGLYSCADFLIHEMGLPLNVRDSIGRSPLHNACMASRPNFKLVRKILNEFPELILFEDNFGRKPFSYINKSNRMDCMEFLVETDIWYRGINKKYQKQVQIQN